ncbi:hypothetical protein ACRAWG_21320 [Methylobacterium sp. P31]
MSTIDLFGLTLAFYGAMPPLGRRARSGMAQPGPPPWCSAGSALPRSGR